jgi:predicted 2-oxoglutarate/Fe(II)-dependent dioxygenase YbiX
MNSKIIQPYAGYYEGGLEYPKAIRYHDGDNFVMHTDGRIFNCHPRINGIWPIRFQIKEYDGNFQFVKELFSS